MDVASNYSASRYPSHPAPLNISLIVLPAHECSYLPGRRATSRAFMAAEMAGSAYHRFMDAGFRRSGRMVYQPVCQGCRECLPIRVPVTTFEPSTSQRRCWRKNQDLTVTAGEPVATDEKFGLYLRYVQLWHARLGEEEDRETFESFLYESPVDTVEFCYRDPSGKLLAVGICDVCAESLSSVYFYHDPAESRRGLGTFGALYEIQAARAQSIPHYYLGYWVKGCGTMEYKSSFRPCEVLEPDGVWRLLA